nr:ethylene-responsive transcription factor 12-like [Lolium perenne]
MAARMRRDIEAVDRSEVGELMAEAKEWHRIAAEVAAGRETYRGVRKLPSGKYAAEFSDPSTRVLSLLGTYDTALVAACAHDIKARSLHGDKATTNFAYPPPPDLIAAVEAVISHRSYAYPPPPEPSFYDVAAAAFHRFCHLSNLLGQSIHILEPARSAETCFSSTGDSASSSTNGPMLKKPRVVARPTTPTPSTDQDCEIAGDNFTEQEQPMVVHTATVVSSDAAL